MRSNEQEPGSPKHWQVRSQKRADAMFRSQHHTAFRAVAFFNGARAVACFNGDKFVVHPTKIQKILLDVVPCDISALKGPQFACEKP